ncbi:hypothetical protein Taro_005248 [Colocasia esculenta]|uniref:Retrotransposon gag domain-containing protein n=1 Tax=Colocasia esculenta TaxID=4460 RepID=A0A843TRV3_COLES|nr:hypothetical protein [Colocasia esculenta]
MWTFRVAVALGGRGVDANLRQTLYLGKFLEWLIEEIGVVEEMIRRKVPSAPVPPVAVPLGDGETVPVAPVPPRVEVPFAAPVPPPPPVLIAEEPVMQVEKFLRLQPPTYSGGPNPDTAEHWVHEIKRVFATMWCPAADRVVLAAYQLRGFALEWWRLKMYRRLVGGSWDVWHCQIGRGNAVAWCNSRGSSRRVRSEPGEFGRFNHVLSCTLGYAPDSCTLFQFCGNMAM